MLFHLTTEDDIRVIHEQGPAETDAGDSTFASEQEFNELAREWPMKRLIEIWNRLPGVQALARFQTAIARIWRTNQPQIEPDRTTERRRFFPMPQLRAASFSRVLYCSCWWPRRCLRYRKFLEIF